MKEGRGPYTSALPLEAQRRKWTQSKPENTKEEIWYLKKAVGRFPNKLVA
jgi:hypothetical protein